MIESTTERGAGSRDHPDRAADEPADEVVAVYRRTVGELYGYVSRRSAGSVALAEDVTQETYLRAVVAWRADGMPDEPLAWLRTVARNLLVSHFRRRRPDPVDPATLEALLADGPAAGARASALVQWAMSRMSRAHAELLEAFHLDGKSTSAIATERGLTERAVEGRLRRARGALRKRLEPLVERTGETT